jgi:hypothetical protein
VEYDFGPPENEPFDVKPIRRTERYRKVERTANKAPVEESGRDLMWVKGIV